MAYNSYGAPPYGRPTGFGSYPIQTGTPTGIGASLGMAGTLPGMSAPGTAPLMGIQQANIAQTNRPSGLPASFQGPTNMPNINFSAPIIRLGTGPSKPIAPAGGILGQNQDHRQGGGRVGIGADRGVESQRQILMSLIPPTKEEIVRTIFIAGITEGVGDDGIERILSAAGKFRRWDRATDAEGKPCSFGFAQYEDVESLSTAVKILKDIEIPLKKQTPDDQVQKEEPDLSTVEKGKLLVFVDDNSMNYLADWDSHRVDNDLTAQSRLDASKQALKAALHELFHPSAFLKPEPGREDVMIQDLDRTDSVEILNIPLAVDDELADIPAEMREIVAKEIAAFRDRSNRRDMERLKREEDMEALERQRNGAPRPSRLASPGPRTPIGPAAGTNNIPLGPRGAPKAPSGPKGGLQMSWDYQKSVSFVNGSGVNNTGSGSVWIDRDDEDDSASDEELERRRRSKREAELEKQYLDQERRWLNRERSRTAAVQREKEREDEDSLKENSEREKLDQRLREWNDDVEAARKVEEYYLDRSMWIRNRAAFRAREAAADERDRNAEQRELEQESANQEQARGMAESFLDRTSDELGSRPESGRTQQPFKLSLGAAAQKVLKEKAAPPRRTVAEVEGLLEDEEDLDKGSKRTLVPIKFDQATSSSVSLTDEERDQAVRQLAAQIPTEKKGLWAWDVKWDMMDDTVIVDKLRPFVEKKIMEYLGVQEQLLVEVVEAHIRSRGKPQDLVEQLEGALDEEAEVLVKKLWRMVVFYSESESKGLTA
ncbi:U1 snRNP-associated protein usp107 [Golovinomyces cichoracearum]|uniref:U1 snRNP-associated protein usp107 n=1 Tax=Golovinomyces cichoracearum TaxID=62708 RepID=A0A420HKE3_9PEZI|nr:U1 snRNP-associated protein usp107 [Golovinomyces cichoracearum]